MLSPQTPKGLPGQHQRQNSTPTKFGIAGTIAPAAHRRGLSDSPVFSSQNHGYDFFKQEQAPASVDYSLGQQLTNTAIMRETQPQLMARPGHSQELIYQQPNHAHTMKQMPRLEHGIENTNDSNFNHMTEINNQMQHSLQQAYNMSSMDFFHFDSTKPAGNLDGFGTGLNGNIGNDQPNQIIDTTTAMSHGMQYNVGSRPTSREGLQQPCTPPSQMRTSYFPLTPATTPYSQIDHSRKFAQSRTTESSPTRRDPNLTIKASHAMQRGGSLQDNFAALRKEAMSLDMPSPPKTAGLEPPKGVDMAAFPPPQFFNMSSLEMEMPPWDGGYNSNYSPVSNAVSSAMSSFNSSPEITHMSLFEPHDGNIASQPMAASNWSSLPASQSSTELESLASPVKVERSQSMSEIEDMFECVENTGITSDEIAAFISIPDADNKWTCLFTNCGKKFGRKENIKSHVQTHLDDRQFRCKDCNKRFVRQHDLKRHANIHSGVRSYPCPCGKQFARHDALTRHRQRGMCVGAFEGTPKKVMKRGRPKKTRPEAEERLEKSAVTRQKALEKLAQRCPGQYASSVSDSSASAYPSPEQFNSPSEQAGSPPELDLSSSSPAAPRTLELNDLYRSQAYSSLFECPVDEADQALFNSLSASLTPGEDGKEAGALMFETFCNMDGDGATLDDFPFETKV